MGRQIEIDNLMLAPIYDSANTLKEDLGYSPPIFRIGRSAVQSIDETQVIIAIRRTSTSRSPYTIAGSMWVGIGMYEISYSVPDRNDKSKDNHILIEKTVGDLVDHYSTDFCNDVDQLYIEDARWDVQIEVSNRTTYMLRLSYRYNEYP